MHGTEGERYVMAPDNFKSRYLTEQPRKSPDAALDREGFQLYRPSGKIWAVRLSDADVAAGFPAGKFTASWGSDMLIAPDDYLATPYPAANEIYRIEAGAFASTYRASASGPCALLLRCCSGCNS